MASHSHKRDTKGRRISKAGLLAAPCAVLVTLSAVTLGVATGKAPTDVDGPSPLLASGAISQSLPERAEQAVSRSFDRTASVGLSATQGQLVSKKFQKKLLTGVSQIETKRAVKQADVELWAVEDLELWSLTGKKPKKAGQFKSGKQILITGRFDEGKAEVVVEGKPFWVDADLLSEDEPIPGIGGSCTNGTSVAGGVSANIVKVHRAVCAAFPEIRVYGTLRGGGGDHGSGRAVDIMVSGGRGQQVADFVRANAGVLGVSYAIYAQRIWSVERGGEGWRGMSNRGSATANHFDHVHVSTF